MQSSAQIIHYGQYYVSGKLHGYKKKQGSTSKDVWLLFVMNDFDQEFITSQIELSIGKEVYVAKRKTHGYEFWEIYKTAINDLARVVYYGSWNTSQGLKATQLSVVERRGDFGGMVFRTPRFEWERTDSPDEKKKVELLRVVWNLLEQKLNFTTNIVFIPNNSSKYKIHNNSIDITVEMLAKNEADVSMIRHWPMLSNTTLIDNSLPLFQTHSRVYMKKIENIDSSFHFFHTFAIELWYFIFFMVTIFLLMILLMHRLGRETGLIRATRNFSDVCITLHQMLCQQGGNLQQELSSIRLLCVFINLWVFLIQAMYSAALASTLAIHHYNVPFHSLEELLANGQYEFGVHRHSWAFSFYYKHQNSFIRKLNRHAMAANISNLPVTYLEGLQRVCSREKYAFLANSELVSGLQSKLPCSLHHLTQRVNKVNFDYAMSKHNEYLPFINRWLQLFKQAGLIDRLKHNLWITPDSSDNPTSFKSLDLNDTALLQLLISGGVVISVGILIAEIIYDLIKRNRRNLNLR